MTTRTLLYLGGTANKCLFTSVQYCRLQLQIPQYRQIRNLRKLDISIKQPKSPFLNINSETGNIQPLKLWKHLAFAVTFSGVSMMGAAIWEYEYIRQETHKILHYYKYLRIHRTGWRGEIETWWNNLTEGQRMFMPILFLNTIVFLAWRVPAWQKAMVRYFTADPSSRVSCWPMVLSMFSHLSIFHLAGNMYVLHSFSTIAVSSLGKEQFLAVYLSGGVISSFVSYLYKTVTRTATMSLGASGAIMGVLGYIFTEFPTIPLHIIFLPAITFTAGTAFKTLMAVEATGCLLRWKYFDHAAHLGGALFGVFWCYWGSQHIWEKRKSFLTLWHELREPRKTQ
ncbi:presenilins-associated rhomboid-like protein, mitochondrial [Odontomachus brunneus]|uniref:presenilins-associated rhomboid-like protein, mitochondrial n=1 Tax=Odontomachus brunneus TaxID=486640 RepID=UPI0013F2AB8B|nr:presenilins-associated rhomboid-like protein, mitochondrial [Odontomachus brunneus]